MAKYTFKYEVSITLDDLKYNSIRSMKESIETKLRKYASSIVYIGYIKA